MAVHIKPWRMPAHAVMRSKRKLSSRNQKREIENEAKNDQMALECKARQTRECDPPVHRPSRKYQRCSPLRAANGTLAYSGA